MVQLAASFVFLLSFTAAGLSAPVKRTVPTIEIDISNFKEQLDSLLDAITRFPLTGGTLQSALNIDNLAQALDKSIQKATADVMANGAIGGSDAATILSSVQGSLPTIDSTLTAIKNKKAAFAALPVGGVPTLVAKDLKALDTDTGRLSFALSSKTPGDLTASWATLDDAIHNGFVDAIAFYTS
ncbi:hypothetical protein CVT25_013204 [Psilocybe cyanescens]|uniref:Hydrophobic surface binding protein n=1 Tax=Psilocybe cyanescens TaxID=93625 RepID=A0A409XLI1_PSICY|nr:hypothetical protein CVT25_013204 [Psilocybe cyanescens]